MYVWYHVLHSSPMKYFHVKPASLTALRYTTVPVCSTLQAFQRLVPSLYCWITFALPLKYHWSTFELPLFILEKVVCVKKSGERYGKGNGTTIPVPFKYPLRTVQVPSAYRSSAFCVPFRYPWGTVSRTLQIPWKYHSVTLQICTYARKKYMYVQSMCTIMYISNAV